MDIWTLEEEAERLKARFADVNRAAFARENKIKGGQAVIYHHINGIRPISRSAAIAYAKGFNVSLAEISPRLAKEATDMAAKCDKSEVLKTGKSTLSKTEYNDQIQKIIALMLTTDERGQIKMLSAAQDALELHLAHQKIMQSHLSSEQMMSEIEHIKKINDLVGEPPSARGRQRPPSKRHQKHQ
jgi:hypothetical protein